MVRLPFKAGPSIDINDSLQIAIALYARTEVRLQSRLEISRLYHDFFRAYLELGHMEPVTEKVSVRTIYIPHHAVIRELSSSTKLRVVLNASCKIRNGTSLNDHLLVGPKLQQDLPAIVARWRQWRYVYTTKMFHQILVHPIDANFQRIIWRPSPESPTAASLSTPYRHVRISSRAIPRDARTPAARDQ